MPRDGSGVYSLPAGTEAISGETIDSSDFNTLTEDLESDANAARPVAAGGTGADNATDALTNLGAQEVDATLTAWAGVTFAANKLGYATGDDAFATTDLTAGGRLVIATTFTDPNADRVFGWDDSAGAFIGFTLGTGLAFNATAIELNSALTDLVAVPLSQTVLGRLDDISAFGATLIDDSDAATARSTLGLGTAAVKNTGTSGNTVPLLDGNNVWSGVNETTNYVDVTTNTIVGAGVRIRAASAGSVALLQFTDNPVTTQWGVVQVSASGYNIASTALSFNSVAVPTISSADTLSNKTLSSPTLSGTVAGTPGWASAQTFPTGTKLSGSSSNSIFFDIENTISSGRKYTLFSSGGGPATLGAFGIYDNTAAAVRFTIEPGGDIVGNGAGPTSIYSLGPRGLGNLNGQNTAYTFALTDAGQNVYHGTGTHAYTIPPNSSVAFPVGTVIEVLQDGGTLTIVEGSGVTLERWDGGGSGTGTRTVGAKSTAVIQKVNTNNWIIMGASIT